MYTRPKNAEASEKWREAWTNFILYFARKENIHVINIMDLKKIEPFSKLDSNSFKDFVETLLKGKIARYWKDNENLRIYWRSVEGWAEQVFHTARNQRKIIIKGKKDVISLEPKLASMPREECSKIIGVLVEKGWARWISRNNETIKLVY